MMDSARDSRLVLLTGATGYVGGRLLRLLEERGERVRCLVRRPAELLSAASPPGTEVVGATCSTRRRCRPALEGVDTAYYLVHSMSSSEPSRSATARRRATSARPRREAGVRRIVYLGGLGRATDTCRAISPAARRSGATPARVGRADDRVPRLDRDRLGQRVVRDRPRARRPAAGDGDAALGRDARRSRSRSRTCSPTSSPRSSSSGARASCTRSAAPTACRTAT